MKRIILILGLLFVIRVDAAMVRVVDVQDGRTIIIERNGSRETVRLAGVAIVDEARAAELLRWNVVSSWVLIEPHASGGHLAFRSPDALFINRELVLRGYARATAHGIEPERNLIVTFLGVIDPPAAPVTATRPRTGTDTSRRPTKTRPPRTRGAGAPSSGRARSSSSKPR
ncbi:MAG: thermonuclease family protein [Thermoanaerobaculia bacterium]